MKSLPLFLDLLLYPLENFDMQLNLSFTYMIIIAIVMSCLGSLFVIEWRRNSLGNLRDILDEVTRRMPSKWN